MTLGVVVGVAVVMAVVGAFLLAQNPVSRRVLLGGGQERGLLSTLFYRYSACTIPFWGVCGYGHAPSLGPTKKHILVGRLESEKHACLFYRR